MKDMTKKIMTGAALIISGYGIANAVKAAKASADAEKKKRKIVDIIILGRSESGTNPHSEECHRCTCHGVPTGKMTVGTVGSGMSFDEKARAVECTTSDNDGFDFERAMRNREMLRKNAEAINALSPDDRAFIESLIDFLRETELVDELDESVTTASLIGYMKENGIFDDIHHICKKKDIACDDIESIIHAIFKVGKFGKHMDAEQKLSVILDDCSSDYFDSDNTENIAQFIPCDV